MQVRLERRWVNGMSLLMSYTWSKSLDLGNGSLVADLTPRNAMDVGWERAMSSGSVPQRFVVSYSYALPVGHGRPFVPQNRLAEGIFGDWQVNGITTVRDGQPFTPALSVSSANNGGRAAPNWNPANVTAGFTPSVNDWFDTAPFSTPVQYTYGNEGRDILRGPGAVNFDASIMKIFDVRRLGEGARVQLRFEGFNILNHPNFAIPSNVTIGAAGVGSITTTTTANRILQAGVKLLF
jgi:hypothetical protein